MWEIFARYGKVVDVFIAGKKNKEGKSFGFARFLEVKNVSVFESTLNTICIGAIKLRCNIARFQKELGTSMKSIGNPTPINHNKPKFREANTNTSYADALKGVQQKPSTIHKKGVQQKPSTIYISHPIVPADSSLVAELKSINGAKCIHNIILDEGFSDFTSKYLGGLHILLQFSDSVTAGICLLSPAIIDCCTSLKRRDNHFRIKNRVTWIAIEGLLPQSWFTESFTKIANHWGEKQSFKKNVILGNLIDRLARFA